MVEKERKIERDLSNVVLLVGYLLKWAYRSAIEFYQPKKDCKCQFYGPLGVPGPGQIQGINCKSFSGRGSKDLWQEMDLYNPNNFVWVSNGNFLHINRVWNLFVFQQ